MFMLVSYLNGKKKNSFFFVLGLVKIIRIGYEIFLALTHNNHCRSHKVQEMIEAKHQ